MVGIPDLRGWDVPSRLPAVVELHSDPSSPRVAFLLDPGQAPRDPTTHCQLTSPLILSASHSSFSLARLLGEKTVDSE